MSSPRRVLVLQGPLSPLYHLIGGHLIDQGSAVLRVNFSGNDVLSWRHSGAVAFRGKPAEWHDFLASEIAPFRPDCVLMHGDRRLYHRIAAAWARAEGVEVYVTELGYLRPDWMTLERGGYSALSRFPVDPVHIRAIARQVGQAQPTAGYSSSMGTLIKGELVFSAANLALWPWYPHYRSHKQPHPARLYPGWALGRLQTALGTAVPDGRIKPPFFVFGLQLDGDFQLRDHSPFADIGEAINHVVGSFARHAPQTSMFALKTHPHEFAHGRLVRTVQRLQAKYSLGKRLVFNSAPTIAAACAGAAGFVSINSSAGIEALAAGIPTCSVMPTVYDVDGLTFQDELDQFWQAASPPDPALFEDFVQALSASVQVQGTLYDPAGCRAAARAMAERILKRSVNQPDAFVDPPPRLAKAKRLGVTYDAI